MKIQFALRSAGVALAFASFAACTPPQTTVSAAPAAPAATVCSSCGVIQSITPVTQAGGATTGTGAVIGAVVGGVAGNQVGGGDGKKVATAAGLIGGALLGNNIEKNRNSTTWYEIDISMQDGSQRMISVQNPGSFSPGTAVNVNGDNITLR